MDPIVAVRIDRRGNKRLIKVYTSRVKNRGLVQYFDITGMTGLEVQALVMENESKRAQNAQGLGGQA